MAAMDQSTTLYLIRHAESLPSVERPEPAWPLSARGHEQARALVPAMLGLGVTAICSSPYPRAVNTVMPLAAALGLEVSIIDALHERVLTRRNLGEQFRATVERYWADADFALEDGESNRACARRMVGAIDALAADHRGETIALASHGNALALYLGTIDPSFDFEQWRSMRNPDLFRVVYRDGRATWDGSRLPTSR
jgi:2,3-bisphosphoglycerate-dependent phosphoglycerate mutase